MRRLASVCARGGSKGLAGKNLRPLLGKSLVGWAVDQARESGLFDVIAVSSDSEAILDAGRAHGADLLVVRPPELAGDEVCKLDAIGHCVKEAESRSGGRFDTLVDLDATSPLRLPEDIHGAVALLEERKVSSVITGCPAHRSPYFNLVELRPNGTVAVAKKPATPIIRRQDVPTCYDMNAAIYVWQRDRFLKEPATFYPDTLLYEMPPERSRDIDCELDFEIVELLMRRRTQV